MAVLPPQTIARLCLPVSAGAEQATADTAWLAERRVLVTPFHARTRHRGKTFGLGPAGYDVRVAESFILWPWWGRLASTIEKFDIPADVTFLVNDKSSWARQFVFAMNTNGEPGWRGTLTLELVRFLPWPVRVRAGDPIANIMFLRLEAPSQTPYEGKYQDQEPGPQAARYDNPSTRSWLRGILTQMTRTVRI